MAQPEGGPAPYTYTCIMCGAPATFYIRPGKNAATSAVAFACCCDIHTTIGIRYVMERVTGSVVVRALNGQ